MHFSDGDDDEKSYHVGQINPYDEDDEDYQRLRWEKFTQTFPPPLEPRVLDTNPKWFLSDFPARRREAEARRREAEAKRTEVEVNPSVHARLREAAKAAVALNADLAPVVYRPISELLSRAEERLQKGSSEPRTRAPFSQSQSFTPSEKQREKNDEDKARYERTLSERRRAWESDMDVVTDRVSRLHIGHDDVPFDAYAVTRDDMPSDGSRRRVLPRSMHAAAGTLYDVARAKVQARAQERDKPLNKAYVSAETPHSIPNKLTGGRRRVRRAVVQYWA
jgi:hypothetical protein